MYHKYRCKTCGKVEYHNEYGARNFPNPFERSCKKSRDGYHQWEQLQSVEKLPTNRTKR